MKVPEARKRFFSEGEIKLMEDNPSDTKLCSTIIQHIKDNSGFCADFLKAHQAECKQCAGVTNITGAVIDYIMKPIVDNLAPEIDEVRDNE